MSNKGKIAALVLAAGSSKRMGEVNKLLAEINGQSMLRRVVASLEHSELDYRLVVTGFQQALIEKSLANCSVNFVHNEHYRQGLASSLCCGIKALPDDIAAVLVVLGDMPLVSAGQIMTLVARWCSAGESSIVVPVEGSRRGNPVLWPRCYWQDMMQLEGDRGAKGLMEKYAEFVCEVAVDNEAYFSDVDTPAALKKIASHRALK